MQLFWVTILEKTTAMVGEKRTIPVTSLRIVASLACTPRNVDVLMSMMHKYTVNGRDQYVQVFDRLPEDTPLTSQILPPVPEQMFSKFVSEDLHKLVDLRDNTPDDSQKI